MRRPARRTPFVEGQPVAKLLVNRSDIHPADIHPADIHHVLDDVLKLTMTPLETYLATSDLGRRLLNQAFFRDIRADEDG